MIVENLEKYPDKIEHAGDLTINCSIPSNYAIKVTDGQLIINGDVGENSSIYAEVEPVNIINGVVVSGKNATNNSCNGSFNLVMSGSKGNIINTGSMMGFPGIRGGVSGEIMINGNNHTQSKWLIKINGNVLNGAVIKSNSHSVECEDVMDNVTISTCNSSISVINVGNNVKIFTSNDSIDANNIGNDCNFTTKNASINIENTLDNCTITTSNAGINIKQLGNNCYLGTKNANISIKNIGKNNKIYTTNGNIKTNNTNKIDNTFYTTNGTIKT